MVKIMHSDTDELTQEKTLLNCLLSNLKTVFLLCSAVGLSKDI